MEQKNTSFWKSSVTYGLYLGLVSIFISVIIWASNLMENMGIFGSLIISVVTILITFILLIIFTKTYRNKDYNGYISFVDAFKFGFTVIIVSTIIGIIYTYIFQTIIDPGYTERIMAVLEQKTLTYMENAGVSEAQINKALERFENVPTLVDSIKQSLMFGLIGGLVLALISSAIVKKSEDSEIG